MALVQTTARTAGPRRRPLSHTLPCAAALVGVVPLLIGTAACGRTDSTADQRQASCVAPFIRADPTRSPPRPGHPTTFGAVQPGQQLRVYGWWYYKGRCEDTQPTAARSTPARHVLLTLVTAGHRTKPLATARPHSPQASFTVTVSVPGEATLGPASISDSHGHAIDLDIVQT